MKEYLLADVNDLRKNDLLYDKYTEKLKKAIRKKKSNKKNKQQIMNNNASVKKKRKKGDTKKKKGKSVNSKKTKKKLKGGGAIDGLKKLWNGEETFETIGKEIIKKIGKQKTYLEKIETEKKENANFVKYKNSVDKIISKKNINIDTIIEKCLSTELDTKKNDKDYHKSLKILFDGIYNTTHRYHRKHRVFSIGRNRNKKNIFKYYSKALFFKIGRMRRYEYYVNKNLVKIILYQLETERLIKKFDLMETKIDEKKKSEYGTIKGEITGKKTEFKTDYEGKFNNEIYKAFKNQQGNYYLSLFRTSLETVSLKQRFDWKHGLKNMFRTKRDKDNRRVVLDKLNNTFYTEIKKKTTDILKKTNALIEMKDEIKFQEFSSAKENYENYEKFHTIQYLNSKAYVKDMYIFKSVYMFNDEVSVSMLDLGQLSMIDNSVIYYYSINNKSTGYKREMMRFDLSDYEKGIEKAIEAKKISLKYLYNLTTLPGFALKHLSLYFENFIEIQKTDKITKGLDSDINKILYYIKKSEKDEKIRADIKKTRQVKESIDNLIKYSESTTKKMTEDIILDIKKRINESIQKITLTELDEGDGLTDFTNNLEGNIRKDIKIAEEYKFITISTLKAMIHLYDYDIKNLFLEKKGVISLPVKGRYYQWNWHENKSVSAFLNIMPKFAKSGQEKKNYLAFKTIKYIYIKIIYLLYFLFDSKDRSIDKYGKYINYETNLLKPPNVHTDEVFKPTLFFYIGLIIPETTNTDPFHNNKDIEESSVDMKEEEDTEDTEDSDEKKRKLKLKFLEEFGIVHNLVSEEVPLGIIYNMIGEYLNELWSLLFDLEKTILYLQSTDEKFKQYSEEENFSINKFDKTTYPKIWNDLGIDNKEDMDNEKGNLNGTERNAKKDRKNNDTHSIYNFTYKSNILYNKQDDKNGFNDMDDKINTEDKIYKKMLDELSSKEFSSTYMNRFKKLFDYYFTKSGNQAQNEDFKTFSKNLKENLDHIITYLRKYFKLTNITIGSKIDSTNAQIGETLSELDKLESLKKLMVENEPIINQIDKIFEIFKAINDFFGRNKLETNIINNTRTEKREKLQDMFKNIKQKKYYDFFTNDLVAFMKLIDTNAVKYSDDFKTNVLTENFVEIFSDETIRKKFDKAFEESIMSPGYVVSNSFFSALRKQLELETLKTKLTDIQKAYEKLNLELDEEQKKKIETDVEFYKTHSDNIDKYLGPDTVTGTGTGTGIKKINYFIENDIEKRNGKDDHATLRLKQIVKRIDMNVG